MAEMISPKIGDFVGLSRRSINDTVSYWQFGVVSEVGTRHVDDQGNAIPKELILRFKVVGQKFSDNLPAHLSPSLTNSVLYTNNNFTVDPDGNISFANENPIIDPEEEIVVGRQTLEIIPDEKIPEELKARTTEFRQNLKLPIS